MATKKKQTTNDQPTLIATPKKQPKTNDDLRQPQVRVLQALSKSKEPLSRAEIAEKGSVDLAMLNSYIGSSDPKVRAKNDKRFKSLLSRGYVKLADQEGPSSYTITAKGRTALSK